MTISRQWLALVLSLLLGQPISTCWAFRQHETVIHENLTITYTEVYNWDKIYNLLAVAIEHNADKPDHEILISLPGLFLKPIWCPKNLNCEFKLDYNQSKEYEFQPEVIVRHGDFYVVCIVKILWKSNV